MVAKKYIEADPNSLAWVAGVFSNLATTLSGARLVPRWVLYCSIDIVFANSTTCKVTVNSKSHAIFKHHSDRVGQATKRDTFTRYRRLFGKQLFSVWRHADFMCACYQ